MRFIAAIPNYNSGDSLGNLVQSILKHGFDEIIVLDDASTDDSLKPVQKYQQVKIVRGETNLGPAGNRNRILANLRQNDIICFIDADMEVLSSGFRQKMKHIFEQETSVGILGGLIFNLNGDPMPFNYGYFSNGWRDAIGGTLERIAQFIPPLRTPLGFLARLFTYNLDIRYAAPKQASVDWVSEAFCIVRGNLFREVNGFNPSLQYHEGQDFAQKVYQSGYQVMFWPEIHAKHLEIQTRPHQRTLIKNWFTLRKVKHRS